MTESQEIVLSPVYDSFEDENLQEIKLHYDSASGKLGEFSRQDFITDYETDGGGYGLITEEDFAIAGISIQEAVNSDHNPFRD